MSFIEVAVSREKKPDFVSRMIMKFTKANYSHILIIKDGFVCHSVGKGVCTEPLNKFLKTRDLSIVKKVKLKVSDDYFWGYVAGSEGKNYSQSQYLGFIFPPLQKFLKNGKEKAICSEYASRILNLCCGFDFKNRDFLSPKDVIEKVLKVESMKINQNSRHHLKHRSA